MSSTGNDDPIGPSKDQAGHKLEKWKKVNSRLDQIETGLSENADIDFNDISLQDADLREKYAPALADINCVLIDLDGTLYNIRNEDIKPTASALKAFQKLKSSEVKPLLVLNTWLESKQQSLKKLNQLGFDVSEEDLFTSSDCCKILMQKHNLFHPFLLVADDVLDDFEETKTRDPTEFDVVIVGLPSTMIDYRLMAKALNMLLDGCPMMVMHPAKTEKSVGTCCVLGPGVFANTLQFATDARQIIAAKPTSGFFLEACLYAGFCPKECAMIGDDITEDIRGAKSATLKAVLVKTGKYTKMDEKKYCLFHPDVIADNFAMAIKYLLCAKSKDSALVEAEKHAAKERAKRQSEQNEFNEKLAAYTADDCHRQPRCPPKVPSFIW